MDDLDILARDFGFGPGGKSKPMRSAQFSEVFGEPAKFSPSTNYSTNTQHSSMGDLDYDSMFNREANSVNNTSSRKTSSASAPVYDEPVYDDDIFKGLPGLKNNSPTSAVRSDSDVFTGISSHTSSKGGNQNHDFDDLLGNLGRSEQAKENIMSSSDRSKSNSTSKGFDDLLAGFGNGASAASNRPITESNSSSVPVGGSKHGSVLDETFLVSESVSTQGSSSSRVFPDPLEESSKHGKSRSTRAEASSGGGRGFDDSDTLGKPTQSFSRGKDTRDKEGIPLRSASPQFVSTREKMGSSSSRYSERNTEKKTPLDNFQEPPLFDMPNFSTDFQKSFDQTAPPQYFEASSQVDMSPTSSGLGQQSDDVWLNVSEIPLFTRPTAAPPPSRPPPPIPHHKLRAETLFPYSSSKKTSDKFHPPSNHSQYSQSPKLSRPVTKGQQLPQFDEPEDFVQGGSQNGLDESVNLHSSEDTNAFSAAADASAAAMKEAMDKAEAKFRHAKEVREREYVKAARYKEPVQPEKDEQDGQERNLREINEILERERKQKEEEEREQIRHQRERERERSREIEREKGRQAVERANREARGRAAVHAREKAAAEAHLRAERAAVEKVSAEVRGRAEKVAVQRVQAEARERAAVDARGRAEKAAAEARERATAAETKDKELREKTFAVSAEVEARRRAERAAVERAATEARERAAAAAAKMNQQRNDDDLESFFSMGRASSAPKARENSTNPFSDQQFQNKGGSESGKRTSSSSGASSNMKKVFSTSNIVDDLSSVFGAPSAGEFQDVGGETEERRQARLERHQRTQERAAKAVAEKNQRDLQAQMEQEERHRIAGTLDIEIKRWAAGKEGNLRALLSSLQYVLWPECGWQPVSLTDLIIGASVKKAYRKATLCIHPDKVQQKGATLQQKYIAEKVFDLLKVLIAPHQKNSSNRS
ncbi:auxilin-related protein 2-like isoform X1 [Salvia miltiorrhiza]|uniref:auxilin-related protein 2-like isoform X1 n=1 Tax=Salvia miltiorrhiza TaxID=226208 RepID=UPI0025AD2004|nr:auxilin-related protein 2-like isoform X1 [Salvia miltiorrhiza]